MKALSKGLLITGFVLSLGSIQLASAAILTQSLGNTAPGFADGATPPVSSLFGPDIISAQSGQAAPFDQGCGTDLFTDCSASWSFNLGAISDPIINATLSFGIADHDSASSGSQLGLFSLDGNALTSELDTLFESGGGSDGEYNVFSLDVSGLMSDLTDGEALINLGLTGVTESIGLFGTQTTQSNGAHLIFSTLTIETLDGPVRVPEPAMLALFGLGITMLGFFRRRI